MLLCDVIAEQHEQTSLKGRKAQLEKNIEEQWLEIEKQKMVEYDERLRSKLERDFVRRQQHCKDVQDQLNDFRLDHVRKMKEDQLEGQLIKRHVQDELEREHQKEIERKERMAKQKEAFEKANQDLLEIQ